MLPATKASFAKALQGLIKKFEADQDTYLSPGYGEAQARTHFITPFFKALGWDVENEAGVPYHLCEVWEEKGETEGRPDYTFRLNGQTKFFIEAKAPSVSLGSPGPILQTKSYAWNSKDVLLAGLTHFEEFRFFDASLEPDERRVLDGEAFHLQWTEYLEKLDLLWELSPERVLQGSLDQFLRRDRKSIRYRVPVDERFLDELTEWRHELASNIHRLNSTVDVTQLNDIVQRLLDRIVFLRIAEERKAIESGQLRELVELWEQRAGKVPIMQDLVNLFSEINDDFNGEIFKPHPCENVKIDSSLLAKIIRRLYPPRSPYRFDVIGVELLGSIYERYLGNTLSVTAKQVRLEPKPEVRKAGGVYYTPKFIVDYIVKNTIGDLLNGKTPKEVEKLRILDPACGSGSFLIGAFQFLIDWHLAYYHDHRKEANLHPMYPEIVKDLDGSERLSFHAKIRIMRQNLYGVDIDQQAVEITMMSLYLKALEAEKGMLAPKKEVLPELKYNIRCGNSLIGPDIEKENPLSAEQRARIRPFDWHSRENGFGDIFASGGFDCVIGNPPYGYMIAPTEQGYFQKAYSHQDYQKDLYLLFLERYEALLRQTGSLGIIVPNTWLQSLTYERIRRYVTNHFRWVRVLHLPEKVFKATVDTHVLILERKNPKVEDTSTLAVDVREGNKIRESHSLPAKTIPHDGSPINVVASFSVQKLYQKIKKASKELSRFCKVVNGIKPFEIGKGTPPQTKETLETQPFVKEGPKPGKAWSPLLRGSFIARYRMTWNQNYWIKYGPWLAAPRDPSVFSAPEKVMIRQTGDSLIATLIPKGFFARNNLHILLPLTPASNLLFLLGLINSRLMDFVYTCMNPEKGEALAEVKKMHVEQLPIRVPGPQVVKRLADRVQRILDLYSAIDGVSDQVRSARLRKISALEAKIDQTVYEVYALSAEEIATIENATPSTHGETSSG